MEFIAFAHVKGKMYWHRDKVDTFFVEGTRQARGNHVVYGAIFSVPDFIFYSGILDSYHRCSLSRIRQNHANDHEHRIETKATIIAFESIEELASLRYREGTEVDVFAYVGNESHDEIMKRINERKNIKRITSAVNPNYSKLIREVKQHEHDKPRSHRL